MAKSRREEKAEVTGGDYEFKLPPFDEKAFIRREVSSAKASFYTLAIGLVAGLVSAILSAVLPPGQWMVGWLPIVAAMLSLRPILARLGFGEEVTAWKALIGSFFMLFFTGLSVWIIGVNVL